jgi:phenylacetate-CoA ligase
MIPSPESAERWNQLRRLLRDTTASNPFYGRKFAAVGCSPEPASPLDFAARFPFTTKAELVADQAAHPPYGTNLSEPLARYTRCHQTSGTTGAPMRWLDTPESWSAMVDDWVSVLRAAGVQPGDRVFFAFSFGPFLGFWLAFEAAQRLGCLGIAGGGMSSSVRARVLLENQCTVLCCTPTYALHLGGILRTEHPELTALPVRTVLVAGEPGGSLPSTRQHIQAVWLGARVFDHHGMTEVGPVTHEVPGRPGSLLVMEDSFYAEILDPVTGQPVPEGHSGELVLTTLRRTASPLIRYRTGDRVIGRRDPTLGNALVLEGGILGRVDDMVILRGVNVYPTAIEELVRRVPAIGEYRVTHDTRQAMAELTIEIESNDATAAEVLERRLQASLAVRIPVTQVPEGTLPKSELKAKRWVRR